MATARATAGASQAEAHTEEIDQREAAHLFRLGHPQEALHTGDLSLQAQATVLRGSHPRRLMAAQATAEAHTEEGDPALLPDRHSAGHRLGEAASPEAADSADEAEERGQAEAPATWSADLILENS